MMAEIKSSRDKGIVGAVSFAFNQFSKYLKIIRGKRNFPQPEKVQGSRTTDTIKF
jgi:hypothetical protein